MKTPLLYKVYRALRQGWKRLTPEAQRAVRSFVASQKTDGGYMNPGGREDTYYRQFGDVLEAVFSPRKLLGMHLQLTVQESRGQDTIYGSFFDFLEAEMRWERPKTVEIGLPQVMTTNAACCLVAMQHQTSSIPDPKLVEWIQARQDEACGFHATELAPIPDLLSTAVALFTLRLVEAEVKDASEFVHAHWLDNGGFAPTLLDEYSDVEYVFYGLLALGEF